MLSDVLIPIATLILGWLLNEAAKRFQMNRERRAIIGRALSNLLELHHQVRTVENYIEHSAPKFSITDESGQAIRLFIEQILPQDNDFVTRYEEAIEQLAEADPVTAFNLRTKGRVPHIFKTIRAIASQQGASIQEITFVENQLKKLLIPHIELAIRELANLHGNPTKKQVEQILDTAFELPTELNDFLQGIQNSMRG